MELKWITRLLRTHFIVRYKEGFDIIRRIWKESFPKNSKKRLTSIEKVVLTLLQFITQLNFEELRHFYTTEWDETNFTDRYVVFYVSGFLFCLLFFWRYFPQALLIGAAMYIVIQNMNTQLRIILVDRYDDKGWDFYSYNRLLLLSIFNYLQIIAGFAVLYLSTESIIYSNCRNIVSNPLDALYFSFITSATLGYGDIVPQSYWGKIFAMIELLCSIMIVSIIIAKFVSLGENQKEKRRQNVVKSDRRISKR
jgi:hypothetical protein